MLLRSSAFIVAQWPLSVGYRSRAAIVPAFSPLNGFSHLIVL